MVLLSALVYYQAIYRTPLLVGVSTNPAQRLRLDVVQLPAARSLLARTRRLDWVLRKADIASKSLDDAVRTLRSADPTARADPLARKLAAQMQAGSASGAPAGSPASYDASCNSTASGQIACRQAAKERAGTTCCECWRRIGLSRRAANGGCIASGSSTARWLICSAPTLASPRRTSFTPATTCCSLTNRRCSRI